MHGGLKTRSAGGRECLFRDVRRAKIRERDAIRMQTAVAVNNGKVKTENGERKFAYRPSAQTRQNTRPSPFRDQMATYSEPVLPGQPINLAKAPWPQLGQGLYVKENQVRASRVGIPQQEGPVRSASHVVSDACLIRAVLAETCYF